MPDTAEDDLLHDYFTEDEMAPELRIVTRTLRNWRSDKAGPPITKLGRRILYAEGERQEVDGIKGDSGMTGSEKEPDQQAAFRTDHLLRSCREESISATLSSITSRAFFTDCKEATSGSASTWFGGGHEKSTGRI